MHIKNQANEKQKIYIKIMFRLKEFEMYATIIKPYKIVLNN